MSNKTLAQSLTGRSGFVVVAELAAGPGFNFGPIEKFLTGAKQTGLDAIPKGFDLVGVTVPQNPGGVANLEPADVLTRLTASDLLGPLDFVPHVSCKDHNADAISSSLVAYRERGVRSVLALTGDKPIGAKGVFEIESVGLLQMIQRMNCASYLKAAPDKWDSVHQFFCGAAVSPFKYTEASQMQQYYKMEKKIAAGAEFLITQVGWDWKKSLELMRTMRDNNIDTPVLGNVYLLTTTTPAPRLMHDGKLPGCFVSDALLAKLQTESLDEHIARAAQQVAMYKAIGAAGVDLGGVHDYDTFVKILTLAAQIGADWEKYKDNLCWPGGQHFYLYDDRGNRAALAKPKKKLRQRTFDLMHRAILDPNYAGFKLFRGTMRALGAEKGRGCVYRLFYASERWFKYLAFDCQDCGDCYLPENFGYCSIGGCEKGFSNAPCGDSTVDGICGNNEDRVCIGDLIYNAAVNKRDGTERLRKQINKPREHALENTASVLNFLFSKDHTRRGPLISIGDALSASDPKTATAMKQLGDQAGGALGYIKAVISSQADDGAAYIAVNIDALTDGDAKAGAKLISQYVKLIRQWGGGVPVCIDSAHDDVLVAGLQEWYNTSQSVKPPLLGPVGRDAAGKIMSLRKEHDFGCIIALADTGELSAGDDARDRARQILQEATGQHGFRPEQLLFEVKAAPLMEDGPTLAGGRGHVHTALETIKKLKSDPALKRCHRVIRTADAMSGLPGRAVGVCRAYVAKALQCGLDAAFLSVAQRYGESPADPGLLELVDAFANMDGSPGRADRARELMDKFCSETKKPKRPAPANAKR